MLPKAAQFKYISSLPYLALAGSFSEGESDKITFVDRRLLLMLKTMRHYCTSCCRQNTFYVLRLGVEPSSGRCGSP